MFWWLSQTDDTVVWCVLFLSVSLPPDDNRKQSFHRYICTAKAVRNKNISELKMDFIHFFQISHVSFIMKYKLFQKDDLAPE